MNKLSRTFLALSVSVFVVSDLCKGVNSYDAYYDDDEYVLVPNVNANGCNERVIDIYKNKDNIQCAIRTQTCSDLYVRYEKCGFLFSNYKNLSSEPTSELFREPIEFILFETHSRDDVLEFFKDDFLPMLNILKDEFKKQHDAKDKQKAIRAEKAESLQKEKLNNKLRVIKGIIIVAGIAALIKYAKKIQSMILFFMQHVYCRASCETLINYFLKRCPQPYPKTFFEAPLKFKIIATWLSQMILLVAMTHLKLDDPSIIHSTIIASLILAYVGIACAAFRE